jgi:3-deoxy-7-phosphoheptulonate synthase
MLAVDMQREVISQPVKPTAAPAAAAESQKAGRRFLVSREAKAEDTVVRVGGASIGGPSFAVIAGPCSVESAEQMLDTARNVRDAGAVILRGGAFKPRTSPYSFQGMGEEGLKLLAEARELTGLPIVTEVMDSEDINLVEDYADILQVGARNVQNFSLLRKVGKTKQAGAPEARSDDHHRRVS